MRTIKTAILILALSLPKLACASTALPDYQLKPYRAHYTASRSGIELGEATQRLTALGRNQFELYYRSHAQLLFLSDTRMERSLFRFRPKTDTLQPYKYEYQREGTGDDERLSLTFDREKQLIHRQDGDSLPWSPPELLDNQLYQLRVRQGLSRNQTEFTFHSIDEEGRPEIQRFRVLGHEQLTLPYGSLETIKLEKVRKNSRRQTFIWFAPALNYVMVRLQQFKDGDEQADIQLTHYQLGSSVSGS